MNPDVPVRLRQVASLLLAHRSLVHQVAFVPTQDDVGALAVGVDLQLTWGTAADTFQDVAHELKCTLRLGVKGLILKTNRNFLVCSYLKHKTTHKNKHFRI